MKYLNRIYNQDCTVGMRDLPSNSVDLVITDPPFAIEFKAHRGNYNHKNKNVLEGYNEIPSDKYLDFTMDWMREAHRLLKDSGSMFVFSGWNNLKDVLIAIDEFNFTTINHITWKYQFGVVCKRKFVTSHYHCLYVCKNDSLRKFFNDSRFGKGDNSDNGGSLRYQDMEDVWLINREYWKDEIKTPTKLPSELIKKILQYASEAGDVILDPFLGSGQVAVISKMLGRNYIGYEIVKEYYEFAKERLESTTEEDARMIDRKQKDIIK